MRLQHGQRVHSKLALLSWGEAGRAPSSPQTVSAHALLAGTDCQASRAAALIKLSQLLGTDSWGCYKAISPLFGTPVPATRVSESYHILLGSLYAAELAAGCTDARYPWRYKHVTRALGVGTM